MELSPQSENVSGASTSSADQIGKVFTVRGGGLRECLVCGELFPRSAAPEHARIVCFPSRLP